MTVNNQTPTSTEQDEFSMAICAIRYCLGRQSYIVSSGARWAREYGAHSSWVRGVVIKDIEHRVKLGGSSLGMEMDRQEWLGVLADLKAMDHLDRRVR